MIYRWADCALAVFPDGQVKIGQPLKTSWFETKISMVDAAQICVCPRGSVVAILMLDSRVLIHTNPSSKAIDITAFVRDLTGDTAIRAVSIAFCTVIVQTDYCVGTITTTRFTTDLFTNAVLGGTVRIYPTEINLFSFGYDHGFVRTVDNKLYLIYDRYEEQNRERLGWPMDQRPSLPIAHKPVSEAEFPEIQNIREMVVYGDRTAFLMCDGTVYESSIYGNTVNRDSVIQIEFPPKETVIKISHMNHRILYITERGACYYGLGSWSLDFRARPIMLQGQAWNFVEDAYLLDRGLAAVIRHDDGKLCYLGFNILGKYGNPVVNIAHLSFFDDKEVVSVIDLSLLICFVTAEGYVYYAQNHDSELVITQDTFIDTNPVAVMAGTQRIRSARSSLDDA